MKSKVSILILILVMSFSHAVLGATEIVYINNDSDDLFLTETGHLFQGTPLISIKEPVIGVTAYFRFRSINIPRFAKINSASLHFFTNDAYDADPLSTVTVYGIDQDNCPAFGDTSDLNSRPSTTASVIWNVSEVRGSVTQHNVTVTSIVQEITQRFLWTSGNNMGFKILGAKGYDVRHLTAHEYPITEAHLNITYQEAPVSGDADYPAWIDTTYGGWDNATIDYHDSYRGLDIWNVTVYAPEFIDFIAGNSQVPADVYYNRYIDPLASSTKISGQNKNDWGVATNARRITRSGGNIYVVTPVLTAGKYQIRVWNSTDDGATWNAGVIVSDGAGMSSYDQSDPSIAVDSDGILHVVWVGENITSGHDHTWYRRYNPANNTLFPIENCFEDQNPDINFETVNPSIDIDKNNVPHVALDSRNNSFSKRQIFYVHRVGGVWSTKIRISNQDVDSNTIPGIVVGTGWNDTHPNLMITWQRSNVGGNRWVKALERYNGSWKTQRDVGAGLAQTPCIAIGPTNNYYYVGFIHHTGVQYALYFRACTGNDVWTGIVQVSDPAQGAYEDHSITVDVAGHVYQFATRESDHDVFAWRDWVGITEIADEADFLDQPNSMMPPDQDEAYTYWFAVINGTVINPDDPCLSEACIEDTIDDYLGPDPDDPEPEMEGWETSPIPRFSLRLYFLIAGFTMIFGPLFYFSWRRPNGGQVVVGCLIMLIGLAFWIQITQI